MASSKAMPAGRAWGMWAISTRKPESLTQEPRSLRLWVKSEGADCSSAEQLAQTTRMPLEPTGTSVTAWTSRGMGMSLSAGAWARAAADERARTNRAEEIRMNRMEIKLNDIWHGGEIIC